MGEPAEEIVPGPALECLVHPDPARVEQALEELRAARRTAAPTRRPLPSGNPAQGLLDPSVQGWCWGAFLAGPFWAAAHGMAPLGGLLLLLTWLFPLPHLLLGRFGGGMAWRQRAFGSLEEFRAVQRAWALGGLLALPLQAALVAGLAWWLFSR